METVEYISLVFDKSDEKQKTVRIADADLELEAAEIAAAVDEILASKCFDSTDVTFDSLKSATKITEAHEALI